jgi:two-component system, OmpR family, phosphate regulon sensor histidine kinase PhoR
VSKRLVFALASWAFITAVALILPSSTARIILVLLTLGLVLALFLDRRFSRASTYSESNKKRDENDDRRPEVFPVETLFPATINNMREGLLVVDRDMRIVASNPAAYRLFGPSPRELEKQRLTELTRNPEIYKAFLDALKGVEHNTVKVDTVGPDRSVFELRVVPLNSNGTGVRGALGVFVDVTRTERLELVRQEFLSNVSHELRTPLTSILAFVETLETGALEDRESSSRFLAIIRKNASRMQGLIDDILELTAIEGGNVQLRATRVELAPLVDEAISSLESKAQARGIRITNQVTADVEVYADARRLERMLTNLIDNGIKFNRPDGQVRIRHEAGPRDKVIVEDDGEGIPRHHLERLFERFYRVDRARSREMGGTGLGLAIVKHLALLHGGEVTVASELRKGTTFAIHLPHEPS